MGKPKAKRGGRVAMSDDEKRKRSDRMRVLRESFELSQDELAARASGLTRNHISKLENEHSIGGKTVLRRVAKALGSSVDALDDYMAGKMTVAQFKVAAGASSDPLAGAQLKDLVVLRDRVAAMPESFHEFLRSSEAVAFTLVDADTVVADYLTHHPRSQSDAAPLGGWAKFFVKVLRAPQIGPQPRRPGATSRFEEAEISELPKRSKTRT